MTTAPQEAVELLQEYRQAVQALAFDMSTQPADFPSRAHIENGFIGLHHVNALADKLAAMVTSWDSPAGGAQ